MLSPRSLTVLLIIRTAALGTRSQFPRTDCSCAHRGRWQEFAAVSRLAPQHELILARMRIPLLVSGLLAGVVASLALLAYTPYLSSSWLAQRLRVQLHAASHEEIAERLEDLARLGDSGVRELVQCLYERRPEIRQAARKQLHAELDKWQTQLSVSQSAPRANRLAQLLSTEAQRGDPDALRASAELAMRLVQWPTAGSTVNGTDLAYRAQRIIESAKSRRGLARPQEPQVVAPAVVRVPEMITESAAAHELANIEPTGIPAPLPESLDLSPLPAPEPGAEQIGLGDATEVPDAQPTEDVLIATQTADDVSDSELFKWLADKAHRDEAVRELRLRGFSGQDLSVAAAAADPDPHVREELAKSLPQIGGVDARKWLVYLLQDESPRVRAAAVRWLATANDPQIDALLRQLSARETDTSVRHALRIHARHR